MTLLSEAYLHLKPFDISEAEIKDLNQYLKVYGKELGKEIYKSEIEIQVEVEAGSLKTWVIYGGILVGFITSYGSFRTGINYLVNDGKKVAQLTNKYIIEKLQPDPQQIYHKERRLSVPGQLQRIISDLDYLSKNINQLP